MLVGSREDQVSFNTTVGVWQKKRQVFVYALQVTFPLLGSCLVVLLDILRA